MRRPGTKYARLVAKNWPLARKKGDALILCRYIEFTRQEIADNQVLIITHEEELDCLLFEADPSVDKEKYHEADKLIGFPWVDISRDPLINAIFIEKISGRRWLITGVLSDDPIKALAQCACTLWHDTTQIAKFASGSCSSPATINISIYEEEMFWSKNPSGTLEQALTDSYVEVQGSVFGPDQSAIDRHAGQRVRFVYTPSIQTTATGSNGAQILFKLQKSAEQEGQPEVWEDVEGSGVDRTLKVAEQDRITFDFIQDSIPLGLNTGTALKYRVLARRSDTSHGATLHAGDIDPTICINAQYMYEQSVELQATGAVASSTTVSGTARAAVETTGSVASGATVSSSGEIAVEASGSVTSGATLTAAGEIAKDATGAVNSSATVAGTVQAAVEATGSVSTGATVSGAGEIAVEASGTISSPATVSATATAAEDASGAVTSSATISATAEAAQEAAGSVASGATLAVSIYVAEEFIWSAPPSSPTADELDLVYEEVLGTTVTIPAKTAGYPNVRLVYNASLSLLATGASGGLCMFQLQTKVGAGSWTDVTDETATKDFAAQDQEERFTFSLDAAFPAGIDPDTEVQLRLVGKTVTVDREVEVHSSLIDPENTAPSCYVQAEYFFS